MKTIINSDLMKRIQYASMNGSKVASDLLALLKANRNRDIHELIGDRQANYFDSVRIVQHGDSCTAVRLEISCCNKDVDNDHFPDKGNPDAPYFPENRTRLSPTAFAKLFTAIEGGDYTEEDWAYFDSAIKLMSKVQIVISDKMRDFEFAYNQTNYTRIRENGGDDTCTLHNSCMRYEDRARNAADFYSHVAAARIMYAKDDNGQVLARAVIWDDVQFGALGMSQSFIERTYFTYHFLRVMMRKAALDHGVLIRKTRNDYSSKTKFTAMADIVREDGQLVVAKGTDFTSDARKNVPVRQWHKKGAPYCDTMTYLSYDRELSQLYLYNKSVYELASMEYTNGCAGKGDYKICPVCGRVHSNREMLCEDCCGEQFKDTIFGKVFIGQVRTWKGMQFPSAVFSNGAQSPNKHTQNWVALQRLFNA